jgi:hypothetical protein
MTLEPVRLPDAATVAAVLAGLTPATGDADLASTLSRAFPGFSFAIAAIDAPYWRDTRTVVAGDGTRIGDHRAWITREVAALDGDLTEFWARHRSGDLRFAEWRGASVFACAATGPGVADYVQIALGREVEWLAGPIVDPDFRPHSLDDLLEPSWVSRDAPMNFSPLAGPVYRLLGHTSGAVVHLRSFLGRCARIERDRREALRPELETRVIREIGPDGSRNVPFLDATPDWFDVAPRELRFFEDWERSSSASERVYDHWALEIRDYEYRGEREVGFVPRPRRFPSERLLADPTLSAPRLMERADAIDREMGCPFAWFFLMAHGYWVDPDVGHAIAAGLREQRVRLPDRDARV